MQNALARIRNPGLRQGLLFGVILGIILLAISFVGFSNLSITLILSLLAAFLAGFRASQETARIVSGTLAGLWVGLIGTFIPSLILMILFLLNIDAYRKSAQTIADQKHLHITYTNSILIEGLLINFALLLVVGILVGVCGGAVGGIIGRNRAQLTPAEEYKEAMFEPPSSTTPVELSTPSQSEGTTMTSKAEDTLSENAYEESPSASETDTTIPHEEENK